MISTRYDPCQRNYDNFVCTVSRSFFKTIFPLFFRLEINASRNGIKTGDKFIASFSVVSPWGEELMVTRIYQFKSGVDRDKIYDRNSSITISKPVEVSNY